MKQAADRIKKAFAKKPKRMEPDEERKVRDEVSEYVADLLARRAAQLARFGGAARRE